MKVRLGDLKRSIMSEISSTLVKRCMAGITPVQGDSDDEGEQFIAALDTNELKGGNVKILGTVTFDRILDVPVESGETIDAFTVNTMFSEAPSVAVALMQLVFGVCKFVVPSKNISPAAKRFIDSYFSQVKNDPSLVTRIDVEEASTNLYFRATLDLKNDSTACVYSDPGQVDVRVEFERGERLLNLVAEKEGIDASDLVNRIREQQRMAFGDAYRSLKSDRPEVKLALSGGEPTVKKLDAAYRTSNFEALIDFLRKIPDPIPPDIEDWLNEYESMFKEFDYPDDVLDRFQKWR